MPPIKQRRGGGRGRGAPPRGRPTTRTNGNNNKRQPAKIAVPSSPVSSSSSSTSPFPNQNDENDDEVEDMETPVFQDEEDESSSSDNDQQPSTWGGRKASDFYKLDNDGEDSDNAQEILREADALDRQRTKHLKDEDYELGQDNEEEQQIISTTPATSSSSLLLRDEAPEVLAMIEEFKAKFTDLQESVTPLLERISHLEQDNEDDESRDEAVAYLSTKMHLLLSYTTNIAFYLMLRAESGGTRAEAHPVIDRLVRLRTLMERLRPLDSRIRREIDRMITMQEHPTVVENGGGGGRGDGDGHARANPLAFRPDLNDLTGGGGGGDDSGEDDEYVAPQIEATAQDKREKRRKEHLNTKARRSELVQDLKQELTGAPVEFREQNRQLDKDLRVDEARRKYEEENFMRLPETKADRQRRKKLEQNAMMGGMNEFAQDFAGAEEDDDVVRELVDGEEEAAGDGRYGNTLEKHRPIVQFVNEMEMARRSKLAGKRGGDDHVVPSKKIKSGTTTTAPEPHQVPRPSSSPTDNDDEDDDEFYKDTVSKKKQRMAERKESYSFPKRFAPEPTRVVEEDEAREASATMIKNRGLTPHRSHTGSARTRLKGKYEKRVKARKGQVKEVRRGVGDMYSGETSGVRTNVVRSRMVGKR